MHRLKERRQTWSLSNRFRKTAVNVYEKMEHALTMIRRRLGRPLLLQDGGEMNSWDPNRYLRFGDERTRRSVDLASRIAVDGPKTVIDLGCGPGNSTQVLRERWPSAHVYGLDSSLEMIASAERSYPDPEWVLGRIEDWSVHEPHDVVFSNAALHWAKAHVALTRYLFGQVAPGGALAFQLPSGAFSPVRSFIHEIASDEA